MGYLILLIVIFIFTIIWYLLLNKDIISPTVISHICFLLCILLSYIGLGSWNSELSLEPKLIFIIFIGLFSFGIGEFINVNIKKKKNNSSKKSIDKKAIYIEKWKVLVSILFLIITILVCVLEIKKVCQNYGFISNDFSSLLSFYRYKTGLFNANMKNAGMWSKLASIMKKISYILSMIYIYIFTNNLAKKEQIKRQVPYIIIILLSLVLGLLSSGRFEMLKYLIALIFSYFIIISKESSKTNKKIIKSVVIFALIIIPLFYYILPLLGRSTKSGFFDYITFYFGGSIPSFNRYLKIPHIASNHFGNETFYGIQQFLYRLHIINYKNIISREWTYFYTNSYVGFGSNVYTSFRRFYADFSYFGVIVCQLIFGFVFSNMYQNAKRKDSIHKFVFYLSFSYMLIDQVRDDLFMTRFIQLNTIVYIFLIYFLVYFIFKLKIKWR